MAAEDDGGPNLTDIIKVDGYDGAAGGIQLRLQMDTALKLQHAFESRGLVAGRSLNLDIGLTGPGNITYQWAHNNVPIPGQTASPFVIAAATTNHSGTYTVSARNKFGSTVARSGTLTVREPLNIGIFASSPLGTTDSSPQIANSLNFIGYNAIAITNELDVPPSISVLPFGSNNAALSNIATVVGALRASIPWQRPDTQAQS